MNAEDRKLVARFLEKERARDNEAKQELLEMGIAPTPHNLRDFIKWKFAYLGAENPSF